MKQTKTHFFNVTVVTEKDIPNLADVIGGRIWSVDGVAPRGVEVVEVVERPLSMAAHLADEISVDSRLPVDLACSMDKPLDLACLLDEPPADTAALGNGHAPGDDLNLVNMDAINAIVTEAVNKKD